MSGSATIGTEQAVLGHTLGFAPMAFPAQVFVGLCSAATPSSETVGGIEASGGGYARMPATFVLIDAHTNIAANVASIEWPAAAAGWGTLGYFELWDALSGGNRLYWGPLVDAASKLPLIITVSAGDIVRFSAGQLAVQAATGSGGTSSIGAYLPLSGGTLTGPLLLAADPTATLGAATKQYVDAHSGTGGGPGFLPLSGGTMLGALTLAADPASALQSATKQYVDGKIASSGVASFNTRTGVVALTPGDVTTALTFTPYDAANPSGYQTAAQVTATLLPYATLASPVFTGNPQAPTAAVGDNDQSIATTAFAQQAVAQAQHNIGRNLIHNPLFNVAQRGAGAWAVNGYTADRWLMFIANGTQSVSLFPLADADRASIGDEAARTCLSCAFTGSATAGSGNQLIQRIEGVRRLSGKTVTVSFYTTAGAALKLGAVLVQSFGTGGSPSASVVTAVQAITIVGSWGHYSMTFALPSASGKTLGTNGDDFTALTLMYSDATGGSPVGVQSGTIQLWGVQLEVGSVATPLEKPDPRYDMSNCQRFYITGGVGMYGYTTAGSFIGGIQTLQTNMRAAPTIAFVSPNYVNSSGIVCSFSTNPYFTWYVTVTASAAANVTSGFTAAADL